MDLDLSQFYQSFFEESLEMLDSMEKGLLDLDLILPLDSEKINSIFRAAHSIKGGSATFGFTIISEFTHAIESYLAQIRDGSRLLTQQEINLLLKSVDCIRQLIDDVKLQKTSNINAVHALQSAFEQLLTTKTTLSTVTENTTKILSQSWNINFQPEDHIFLTGNDPLRLFQVLAEWGTIQATLDISRIPTFTALNPEICYLSWQLQLHANVEQKKIEDVFEWVTDSSNLKITANKTANTPISNKTEPQLATEITEHKRETIKNQTDSATLRVATNKVDTLINVIGELVIIRSSLTQLAANFQPNQVTQLQEIVAQLELNCQELQQQALHIRMLPVSSIFNRFPRLVRDCAQKLGKQVELQLYGIQTEIDKAMLERLVAPLEHLLRNCIDHGIELPDVRIAKSKAAQGIIKINAFQQGGNIIIEVSDDGAGLSRDKIYAKAVANSLIAEQEILNDTQVYDLIFKPGFSTAETVTDVSGRGVGMDVVLQNIHDLGGSIAVQSSEDQGTTFTLRLPLTLAIMDCQLIKVAGQTYIIPLNTITEIAKIDPEALEQMPDESYLYQLRGKYIPIIQLKKVLTDSSAKIINIHEQFLVVVDAHNQLFGLLVEDLLSQQQIVIKNLEDNYQKIEGIAGATILGDGSIGLVLDVNHLIVGSHQHNMAFLADKKGKNNEEAFTIIETTYAAKAPDEILQILCFKLGNYEYGIDILNVMEIRSWEQSTALPKAPSHVTGIINLRGLIIPVIDLRLRFNLQTKAADKYTAIIILKLSVADKSKLVGFVVDAVSDTYSFSYGSIQPVPDNNNQSMQFAVQGLITIGKKIITLLNTSTLLP